MKWMKMIIVMVLLVIFVQNAYALGVSPARKVIEFKPMLSEEISLRVLNTQDKEVNVVVSKSGELSDYVDLGEDVVSFAAGEKEKSFTYKVNLPESIDKPGEHDARISFTEVSGGLTGITGIGGRAAVVSQLKVNVPYPRKYAEAKLYVSSKDDDVMITISVSNLGTEDIMVRAKIIIEGLDEIDTDSIEIKAGEVKKIVEHFSVPSIGAYKAVAEVYYENEIIELEKEFYVGDVFVTVKDVLFDKLKLGEIVKFDIIAQNGWNSEIKDVYADVFIKKEGQILDRAKTAAVDIDAFSEKMLTAYWDTSKFGVGKYELLVKLNYEGKVSEKSLEINVEEREIRVGEKKPVDISVVAAIAIMIIILLMAVIAHRKRKRND